MGIVRKFLGAVIILMVVISVIGCGYDTDKEDVEQGVELNIAYQYGLAYAPAVICQKQNLIEKKFEELTGKKVTINWNQMSSGADINTGIASNSIQVGFMGIAPAITGISNNIGYKVFTNVSGQEHGLVTNDESIQNLGDLIESDAQIALVNMGSIQHIILAKALVSSGYGAHDLDTKIVAMKHPDGMAAVESKAIACHLTSNPYIFKERNNSELYELKEVNEAYPVGNSFIVGVASESLYNEEPELYKALCYAMEEAIDYINSDPENAAKYTYEIDGNELEDEVFYMKSGSYSIETKGLFELAQFMAQHEFIETGFQSYSELVFDNVKGD